MKSYYYVLKVYSDAQPDVEQKFSTLLGAQRWAKSQAQLCSNRYEVVKIVYAVAAEPTEIPVRSETYS
jgi:hypothetical protein